MSKAIIVLSGGQDSTTCLFMAKQQFSELHAITFSYGQRHRIEIDAAIKVAEMAKVASHEVVPLGPGILRTSSPLVNLNNNVGRYAKMEDMPSGVEPTFVPGRNALFLTLAANRAMAIGDCRNIITGVCQVDFGGYPDCRQNFIDAMRQALSLAMTGDSSYFAIHTPLMNLTKADTVRLATKVPGAYDALAYSHTCYNGKYPPDPHNHASMVRAKGFYDAGLSDPLILRAIREGKLPQDYPASGYVVGTGYAEADLATV
jgi:7-cyano-7-deazaguanine synthase